MSHAQRQTDNRLPAEIRRLATRPDFRRSLRASPQFQLETGMPDAISALLETLDRVEQRADHNRRG